MAKMLFFFLLVVTIASADDKNIKRNELTDEKYEYNLMSEFGCNPPEKWKLIRDESKDGYVKDLCLPRTYQINEPPNLKKGSDVYVLFKNKQIGNIDERNKIITMHIQV